MRREPELERLYDEHAQPLYAFLLNFTRDESDTRDLLQEIFVKLARDTGIAGRRSRRTRLSHPAGTQRGD